MEAVGTFHNSVYGITIILIPHSNKDITRNRDMQMENKHMKRCTTSFFMKDLQIKIISQ